MKRVIGRILIGVLVIVSLVYKPIGCIEAQSGKSSTLSEQDIAYSDTPNSQGKDYQTQNASGRNSEVGCNVPKVMYLTFDDGPSEYTEQLLDLLEAHQMKATFFMLEPEMKRYPNAVKRIVEEGHAVGIHGVSHEKDCFYSGSDGPFKEIEQGNTTLEQITGMRAQLVRTPYGSYPYLTKSQYDMLTSHGYILWDWNIDSKDWSYRNATRTFQATTKMIASSQKEPMVVLFHDIHHVLETMELFVNWMEENNYCSEPITTDLEPVKLGQNKKK